jgi:transcriptional regulator with XRE-family HTH domain
VEERKTIGSLRLGREIAALRNRSKMSQDDLTARINTGRTKPLVPKTQLWRLESGIRLPSHEQLELILAALDVDAGTRERLEHLRANGAKRGWWKDYGSLLSENGELAIELASVAQTMRAYEPIFVHTLIQTEEYTRTLIQSSGTYVKPVDMDQMIELRRRRKQRLLDDDFTLLTVLMTEAVLTHCVGGADVMLRQLEHLHETATNPKIDVRILPAKNGPWPDLGTAVIYDLPDEHYPEAVFTVDDLGSRLFDDPVTTRTTTYAFNSALARSLSTPDSLALVDAAIQELT